MKQLTMAEMQNVALEVLKKLQIFVKLIFGI